MTTAEFGVTGLAVMGQNLARNIGRHGVRTAVHNRTLVRTTDFMERYGHEGTFVGTTTAEEFAAALERPRRIMMMVKAGDPVDALIAELGPFLEPGDILIDGGNSLYGDTIRRERALRERGIHFIGCGVSGGEEGALNGPSIMPGASPEAYAAVQGVLRQIAAQVDGEPCCTLVGANGAGHYVKMVHNGIEYADMQLIAEAYDLLRSGLGLSAPEIADIFEEWNRGELDSFLIEITSRVLRQVDAATGEPLVDLIVDQAEQKGTGRWTAQSALELGVPITGITEAVFARVVSSRREERIAASKVLPGPSGARAGNPDGLVEDVRRALYASKIVAYAQGFEQMAAAAAQFGWDIDLGAMARIWRGGCIIRARFLDRITEAYAQNPRQPSLLLVDYFHPALADAQDAWRRVVATAVEIGVPVPVFSSSLAYYDAFRRETLPANLIQGLRDLFGAHTYRRVDREGIFHTRWSEDGGEVEVLPVGRPEGVTKVDHADN